MSAVEIAKVGWTVPEIRSDIIPVDVWEPEECETHIVYPDVQDCIDFHVMPGTALCGFVFTTGNDLGPTALVAGDPRFVLEECQRCIDVAAVHVLEVQRQR